MCVIPTGEVSQAHTWPGKRLVPKNRQYLGWGHRTSEEGEGWGILEVFLEEV